MDPARLATVKAEHKRTEVFGREHLSDLRSPRIDSGSVPWVAVKGNRVMCDNGFGSRSLAEIRAIPCGPGVREFGVSFTSPAHRPLHWLRVSDYCRTWAPA